ncbi:MAG: sugar phosphate nucleotidyltransferase [candidate division WOR-3 bacterium]|nr:sugar phosphate nucleotidyltransferase [candidate division WOR-3 bacterium]
MLAGGQGERFWPLSQPEFPKQFIGIFNGQPLINQTIDRIKIRFKKNERFLVIPEELKNITRKFVGNENLIIEPARKNTAPAICLGAMILKERYGDGVIHIMPADHIIMKKEEFLKCLKYGEEMAKEGFLVTYGIVPKRPETGYGYIKIGHAIKKKEGLTSYYGEKFTEKPSLARANQYIKTKRYLWNSGIFTYRITTILDEIKKYIPEVYEGVLNYLKYENKRYFEDIPAISIDHGVMEKSCKICVVKSDFGWDDVGTWLALERYFKKDDQKNISIGNVVTLETRDSIIFSDNIPVKVWGVNGLVIVASPYGILVCKKEKIPELKVLISKRRS